MLDTSLIVEVQDLPVEDCTSDDMVRIYLFQVGFHLTGIAGVINAYSWCNSYLRYSSLRPS